MQRIQAAVDADPEGYLYIPVALDHPSHAIAQYGSGSDLGHLRHSSRAATDQTGILTAQGVKVLSADTQEDTGESCDVWWTPLIGGDLTEFGNPLTSTTSLASKYYNDQYTQTGQHPSLSVRLWRPGMMSSHSAGRPIHSLRRLLPGEHSVRPDLNAMEYTLEPLFRAHPSDPSLLIANFQTRDGGLWTAKDTPDWHLVASRAAEVGINGEWFPLYRQEGTQVLYRGQGGQLKAQNTGRYVVAGSLLATNWQSARSNSEQNETESSRLEAKGGMSVDKKT